MHAQRSRLGVSLSRRTCSLLLGALVAFLTLAFGPLVAPAGATAAPEKTDVMFIFDTSGSMSGELEEAKEKIVEVMEHTNAVLPNAEYGVAEVRDYPFSEDTPADEKEVEETFEKPWKLDQPLSSSTAAVKAAIEPLYAAGGGDDPESYGRALWETDTNPNVGWRAGARHEIVLVADNVPHDNNLDEGIPESEWVEPEPWNTDFDGIPGSWELPGKWGIPGTAWTPDTNLDFQTIARELGTDGKPLESVEFYGDETGYLPYWEYWAGLSGGQAVNGINGAGELASKLIAIIETGATKPLAACPTGEERNAESVCVVPTKPTSHPTVTQVICNLVIATATDTCTATVGDAASSGATNPTGTVTFKSSSGGVFIAGNTCNLVNTPLSGNTSSCSVQFLPPTSASSGPAITATYSGDGTHNSSSGSTHYPPLSGLEKDVDLSELGTIKPGGTVEVPIGCGFPCITSGDLLTGPGLAGLASFSPAQPASLGYAASSHGKKKKKAPVLLGKGTLKLNKAGQGKLIIKLTPKARRALGHVGKRGVRVTLKVRIEIANGTLVGIKTEVITLHKAKKHKGKGNKHH